MNKSLRSALLLCLIATWVVPGCALLSKSQAGLVRYFSLEQAIDLPAVPPDEDPAARGDLPALRLGRVTGAPHLDNRLVYRSSPSEIGYYRELRWTEPPADYLDRMLARVLFEDLGLQHAVGGAGPALKVQLTVFDEIRAPPERLARAQVVAQLYDDRRVLWEQTVTVDRPITEPAEGDEVLAVVDAFGEAMQAAVVRIADRVVHELAERR